jgi:Protein of unknown function (DUF2914)
MKKYGAMMFGLILVFAAVLGMILSAYSEEAVKPAAAKPETTAIGTVKPQAAPMEAADFMVNRLVMGTGVENSEPVGVAETFPATTEKVYCFLEAGNITKDTEASFVWFHGDKEMLKTNLALKMGPRWRTYANKTVMAMKGDWKVEIRDQAGKALKEIKFKVE